MSQQKFTYLTFLITFMTLAFSSCVTQQKHADIKEKKEELEQKHEECSEKRDQLIKENEELQETVEKLKKENRTLTNDTTRMGSSLRKLNRLYEELDQTHEKLLANYKELLNNSTQKSKELSESLAEREQELQEAKKDLQKREARISELENILENKEKAVNKLKKQVSDALLNFKESELSVEVKNGKVYVSMAEKLLFESGKYDVDNTGKQALEKLADVLTKKQDVNIMVEGHTDDVPISTDCIQDNWELSVLRATSIVRILANKGVSPERLIAAGRGEHKPLVKNSTKTNRRKNRRTEIILTPELNKLFKILERN